LAGPFLGSGSGDGSGDTAGVKITNGADWNGAGGPSPGAKYPGSLGGKVCLTILSTNSHVTLEQRRLKAV